MIWCILIFTNSRLCIVVDLKVLRGVTFTLVRRFAAPIRRVFRGWGVAMSSRPELNPPKAGPQIAGADVASTRHRVFAVLAATALSVGAQIAQFQVAQAQEARSEPATTAASNDALLKRMGQMEQRIRMLESQLKQKDTKEI